MARRITRVRLKVTLKCGSKVWGKGMVLGEPIPVEVIEELRLKTGAVEVVASEEVPPRPVLKIVRNFTPTTTAVNVVNYDLEEPSLLSKDTNTIEPDEEPKGKKKKSKKRVPIKKIKSMRT